MASTGWGGGGTPDFGLDRSVQRGLVQLQGSRMLEIICKHLRGLAVQAGALRAVGSRYPILSQRTRKDGAPRLFQLG